MFGITIPSVGVLGTSSYTLSRRQVCHMVYHVQTVGSAHLSMMIILVSSDGSMTLLIMTVAGYLLVWTLLYQSFRRYFLADSKYILVSTTQSYCPDCHVTVDLLCHADIIRAASFYICFICRKVFQVGVGPVNRS